MQALVEDRESFLRMDSVRSFVFICLIAGSLWLFVQNKLKEAYFLPIVCILVLIDLWSVDKRYLDNSDFKSKRNHELEAFSPTPANEMILQDTDPYFRVFNTTSGITMDAFTSYFHKSVGGYSAIKLSRYQDLIDSCLSRGNMGVFNMLNTKYFIVQDPQTKSPIAQRNPDASGNAWFASSYKLVDNADEELNSLKNINPKGVAFVDKTFKGNLSGLEITDTSNGSISLATYHPHRLVYQSESQTEGLGIFSEIYYQPGWNAYIDGKITPHLRANYVLRGLRIPAGKHKIEFKFEPSHYFVGEKIALVGSIVLVVFLLTVVAAIIYQNSRKRNLAI
jgi:hypothetical protein